MGGIKMIINYGNSCVEPENCTHFDNNLLYVKDLTELTQFFIIVVVAVVLLLYHQQKTKNRWLHKCITGRKTTDRQRCRAAVLGG